jgi:phospholipid/cholesterol/gamma-HCH transport system ATP-binding protein
LTVRDRLGEGDPTGSRPATPSGPGTPATILDEEPAHVDALGLRLAYGANKVFDGLSCRFAQGAISCIIGASGSGKSTLLKLIACLIKPDFGDIWVGDQEITCMPESQAMVFRRRIGMLFQAGALLDSMTVFENVALPLREKTRLTEKEIEEEVHLQFEAVGLDKVDKLLPGELSGGMRKRVALARAMITRPEILLVDEPFSGLDPIAVRVVEALLLDLRERTGVTMILVNHDIPSTMRIADQIVFIVGRRTLSGSVEEMQQSEDRRVRAFIDAASPGEVDPSVWQGQESEL